MTKDIVPTPWHECVHTLKAYAHIDHTDTYIQTERLICRWIYRQMYRQTGTQSPMDTTHYTMHCRGEAMDWSIAVCEEV